MSSVAYFDFDDTLFAGDSILYWKRFISRKHPNLFYKVFNLILIILCGFKIVHPSKLKLYFFLPLIKLSENHRQKLVKEFFTEEILPRLYPLMVNKVQEHYQKGHLVVIISASASLYLSELKLYFPYARIIGSDILLDKKTPYYGKWGNMKNATKVNYIKAQPDLPTTGKNCYSYSDGYADRFLLNFTEHSFATQPSKKMNALAKQKKWKIIWSDYNLSPWKIKLEKLCLLVFDVCLYRKS